MVDSYVAAQIAAKNRPSVVKTKLLNLRSKYPSGLILAVEGVDDKVVYSKWLGRCCSNIRLEYLVCGGKRQVRELRNLLCRDKNNLQLDVKMVVDRDFDELRGFASTDNVYMLDRYSIENYLVAPDVVDGVLAVAYPCHGEPIIREAISEAFTEDYRQFLLASKEINRRIFIGRALGAQIDDEIPKSISALADVAVAGVVDKECNADEVLPLEIAISEDERLRLSDEFESLIPHERYRGKFAFKFFLKWLDSLAEEFRNPKLNLFGSVTLDGRIDHSEINMGSFASKSTIPAGLSAFIAN